ncbi:omega-amidase NIT2 isoform X2 [Lycorma delicatula]|uniref:omega-amidase NIT2 isoform X2 n=1 Tax=Lycorma delicatula TaxID=130591 RepID=UPI003F514780
MERLQFTFLEYFPQYAESVPDGETCQELSRVAKENKVYLVGGSLPEKFENKYYNTCTIWGPDGELIDYHRKIHLFDIDVPGGQKFTESDVLSPGNKFTIFDNGICKIGVGICYDVRFSELFHIYRKEGISMLLLPAAFNMTTGPLHWELLMRGRAIDEQIFVAACSPAQCPDSDYKAYGHSIIVNPWGKVIKQAEFNEEILTADIDLNECDNARQSIPIFKQRRTDLYDTVKCQL